MGRLEERPVHVRSHYRNVNGRRVKVKTPTRKQKVRVNIGNKGKRNDREPREPRPPKSQGSEAISEVEELDELCGKGETEIGLSEEEVRSIIKVAEGDYVGVMAKLLSQTSVFECRNSEKLAGEIMESVMDFSEEGEVFENALGILSEHVSEKTAARRLARVIAIALTAM